VIDIEPPAVAYTFRETARCRIDVRAQAGVPEQKLLQGHFVHSRGQVALVTMVRSGNISLHLRTVEIRVIIIARVESERSSRHLRLTTRAHLGGCRFREW
jgi:hypothetical protein